MQNYLSPIVPCCYHPYQWSQLLDRADTIVRQNDGFGLREPGRLQQRLQQSGIFIPGQYNCNRVLSYTLFNTQRADIKLYPDLVIHSRYIHCTLSNP